MEKIIQQEIKESFNRIGLEYKPSNGETSIQMKIGFSQTAREYYKSKQTTLAGQDSADQTGITIAATAELSPITEEIDLSDTIPNTTEMPEVNNQTPDEVDVAGI